MTKQKSTEELLHIQKESEDFIRSQVKNIILENKKLTNQIQLFIELLPNILEQTHEVNSEISYDIQLGTLVGLGLRPIEDIYSKQFAKNISIVVNDLNEVLKENLKNGQCIARVIEHFIDQNMAKLENRAMGKFTKKLEYLQINRSAIEHFEDMIFKRDKKTKKRIVIKKIFRNFSIGSFSLATGIGIGFLLHQSSK